MWGSDDTEWADCSDCGAAFERETNQRWKRRCLDCWRESQGLPPRSRWAGTRPQAQPQDNSVRALQAQIARLEAQIRDLRSELIWAQLDVRAAREAEAPAGLTLAEITEAIRLCHPDKHANSPAANALTARLNAIRKRLKGTS